ncbi:DUF1918 domain-containing protein [Actinomadura sp. ATCC 31491]|uniref:DUF1918 domain-containing protein n=1 Tax=Actinomadura luzonensis TaxID=2805427 RepID=A0ABT0G2Z7_9ACTN|nr:DUF1918 domain-containing protein [Actinomadura luzonensis]MCK2218982.1 DUF1918 domain-containing protein [Actinomadura luzonensis]
MKASAGDRLIVEGTYGGDVRKEGLIIQVEHADGSPPYLVRWLEDGHESLVYPGPDARIVAAAR